WRSCIIELTTAIGVAPLLYSTMGSPYFHKLIACDASLDGQGVVATHATHSELSQLASFSGLRGPFGAISNRICLMCHSPTKQSPRDILSSNLNTYAAQGNTHAIPSQGHGLSLATISGKETSLLHAMPWPHGEIFTGAAQVSHHFIPLLCHALASLPATLVAETRRHMLSNKPSLVIISLCQPSGYLHQS